MYKQLQKFLIGLLLLFQIVAAGESVVGPASPEHDKGWMTAGLGNDAPFDLGFSVTANYGREHFWQLAWNGSSIFDLGGETTHIKSYSLARGYSISSRWTRLSLAAGPAFVEGLGWRDNDTRDLKYFRTIGLILNAQYILTPIKEAGVGLEFYGNLNSEISVLGIRLIAVLEGNK
jgi:hypothetical protein